MTDTRPGMDPAVFDAAVLANVQSLLPGERVRKYLQELERDYLALVDSAPTEGCLQSQAHNIVSAAGMLGLTRMSDCARKLEDACRSGAGSADALVQCRAATEDVRLYARPAAGLPTD